MAPTTPLARNPSVTQHTLNARRLLCPMPVIRVQDYVATLDVGEIVSVVCTDPGALQDIPAWCRINGHAVKSTFAKDGEYIITLEVGGVK